MRQRKPVHTIRRWRSVMGRVALIVSVWHAPLPMLHSHDADIHDPDAAATVVHHLAEYHPEVSVNSHFDFGWHWHLVPPPVTHPIEESDHGNCPFCPQDSPENVIQAQLSTSMLQSLCAWSSVIWISTPISTAAPSHVNPAASNQFLDTYLGSVPLGTLLRVARC